MSKSKQETPISIPDFIESQISGWLTILFKTVVSMVSGLSDNQSAFLNSVQISFGFNSLFDDNNNAKLSKSIRDENGKAILTLNLKGVRTWQQLTWILFVSIGECLSMDMKGKTKRDMKVESNKQFGIIPSKVDSIDEFETGINNPVLFDSLYGQIRQLHDLPESGSLLPECFHFKLKAFEPKPLKRKFVVNCKACNKFSVVSEDKIDSISFCQFCGSSALDKVEKVKGVKVTKPVPFVVSAPDLSK